MHLSRITIKNFRNFSYFSVDLYPTTVFVGENRVGKTNLLAALRILFDPRMSDHERKLEAEDFWDGLDKPFGGAEIEISAEITGFAGNEFAEAILADCLVSNDPLIARVTYKYRPRASIFPTDEDDYEIILFCGEDEKIKFDRAMRDSISIFVLPALRDAEREISNWRNSPLKPLLERLEIDSDAMAKIVSAIENANDSLLNEEPIKNLTEALSARMLDMAGTFHGLESKFGFLATVPDQVLRGIKIFVEGERQRPLSYSSLGTTNLLYLVLLLEDMSQRIAAIETVNTILGIEEPEAHLHPQIQRTVFGYFLRQSAPILLTTHSPHIVSISPLSSIVLIRIMGSEGAKAFTYDKDDINQQQAMDLERYLDVTRAEILFAKGVVLVEGIAEKYLIPAFASALGLDLDQLGISICEVHGTDFLPYKRLLSEKSFGIPNVVITDGDNTGEGRVSSPGFQRGLKIAGIELSEDQKDKHERALIESGVFVGNRTLELDLIEVFPDAFIQAYVDITHSETKAENLKGDVADYLNGNHDAGEKILNRIERIGKGRLAQRLATIVLENKASFQQPPRYILDALRRIREEVESIEK